MQEATSTMPLTMLVLKLVGAIVGTSLLWLGAALRSEAHLMGSWRALPIALATALGAAGLWWPSHFHARHDVACELAFIAALIMAPLADAAARDSLRSNRTAALALTGFALAMVFALLVQPQSLGSLSLVAMAGSAMIGGLAFAVFGVAHAGRLGTLEGSWVRGVAAAATSLLVALLDTSAAPTVEAESLVLQLAMLVTIVLLGATLLGVLRHNMTRVTALVQAKDREALDKDPLTRLATRRSFEMTLKRAAREARAKKESMALLFIDLDGFKAVNESYGHADGDRLIAEMAARLRKVARATDVLARVGADEMLLLMREDADPASVEDVAFKIVAKLSAPFVLKAREISLTCSIGVARFPRHGNHDELIARADTAAQFAKRAGGGRHAIFEARMEGDARERLALTSDLRAALERNELELHFQPKVDAASQQITAAEALLRWRHPTRGMVNPATFIPIAEQNGLITPIGDWVIDQACRQASAWRDAGLRMRVAFNLSALQVGQNDIVDKITGALRRHHIEPSQITCEVTESVAMADTEAAQRTLAALGREGIHISIDDFGTGYSSLAYLRKLPAEELKIDRSFVADLEASVDARAIADGVIKLAHALGLRVVAEGVETPAQARILIGMGCNQLQGFLFGRPMPPGELLAMALEHGQNHAMGFRDSLFVDAPRRTVAAPL